MSKSKLLFVIRTPRETIIESELASLRVPTSTGQVGLRPRSEPTVLPIEAGLIVMRLGDRVLYAGTAGGLLHSDGATASLLTPLAVTGEDVESVSRELETLLSAPSQEMEVRRSLALLETHILQELRRDDATATAPPR